MGWTPLHCAAWSGDATITKLLVNKEADVNAITAVRTIQIVSCFMCPFDVLSCRASAFACMHNCVCLCLQLKGAGWGWCEVNRGGARREKVVHCDVCGFGERRAGHVRPRAAAMKTAHSMTHIRRFSNLSTQTDMATPLHIAVYMDNRSAAHFLLTMGKADQNACTTVQRPDASPADQWEEEE